MIRVSKDNPCRVCGHQDWCMISDDGTFAICPRTPSDRVVGEAGYYHKLDTKIETKNMKQSRKILVNMHWDNLHDSYIKKLLPFDGHESLCEILDVSHSTLEIYGCGWDGECYTIPLRNEYNNIIGIQRRFLDGKKRMITGSRAGLFLPQGINCARNQYVYICEGFSDTATCMELGFFAIGRMSATTGTMTLARLLKGRNVVIVGDNDKAGIDAANKLFSKLKHHSCNACVITAGIGKDLREWVKKDKENAIKALTLAVE